MRPRARPARSRIPGLPRYTFTCSAAAPRTFTAGERSRGATRSASSRDCVSAGKRANHSATAVSSWPGKIQRTSRLPTPAMTGPSDMSRSSGLVGLIDLGEQVTLGSPGGGLIAAPAAQDEGDADGEHGASDRPRDVDPVAGEGGADQVGSEGAGRVHRGARDGAAPQAGQGDVAADPEGADDADVLGARSGAQDHADQAHGQDELHPER